MTDLIDSINLRQMRSGAAVKIYSLPGGLSPAEQASLDVVAAQARGRRILDIGVGGGRTVEALRAVSTDYLGIDNSPQMVEACRARHPGARFELADARRLDLPDASVGLVMFSCNGIGMVGHEDRLLILREVHRVLEPGGVFLFSTHNQNCPDHDKGFQFPQFVVTRNPVLLGIRALRFVWHTGVSLVNRARFSRHDLRTPEYSVINDYCHDYGVMLYYITLDNQRRQLEAAGFRSQAQAFDLDGRPIAEGADSTLSSIAFIARK